MNEFVNFLYVLAIATTTLIILIANFTYLFRLGSDDDIEIHLQMPTTVGGIFGKVFLAPVVISVIIYFACKRIGSIPLPKPKICPYCHLPDCYGMKAKCVKGVRA
jgi:hypothetical protein